ncbi:MAG: cytochrome d ubiquinol oxidase subunit II [Bacteroidetes bacterium]|nr:cytochrome d ubiquinol oxidase subunit II [Bacteroidota bacterium]MBU1115704.1 cytochrome d ubiquinol oxidase subunit II [Bacteroidota bacterium]MBU1799939.1 cytochrome d ubiquinol oxidase subunit II [Bacteroidota bacterium]
MDLNIIWFILVTVLFIGFFFLEGFDYGVGILLPFLGKDDKARRVIINTIGPHWDGNEVWLLTAGGAIFAAFPHWYATMFSGFYLALFLMLVAIIVRAVSFEFRSKDENSKWRNTWDWIIFFGSAVPALLWGVALANLIRGLPIDETMTYTGGFFNLLNPYAIVGGVASFLLFTLHGAIFLTLKTTDDILESAKATARKLWLPSTIVLLLFVVYSYIETDVIAGFGINPGVVPIVALLAILSVGYFLKVKREGWAFIMMGITIAFSTISIFSGLFPRVMVSSTNPDWSLTIYNASSSDYTLGVMSIVALIFVPIVLIYQSWTYWVFRKRISRKSELEY